MSAMSKVLYKYDDDQIKKKLKESEQHKKEVRRRHFVKFCVNW